MDYSWSVHARVQPSSKVLCVKRFNGVHTCGAAVRTYRNLCTGSELVSSIVADRVYGQSLVSRKRGVKFMGITLCHSTNSDGFNHCRPLLFLDETFLKGRFKGNLLAATTKDDNQGLFPVTFAIVDSENSAN
ncbi:hypothetical protein ACSBR1_024375 [Camellia fascicularis]